MMLERCKSAVSSANMRMRSSFAEMCFSASNFDSIRFVDLGVLPGLSMPSALGDSNAVTAAGACGERLPDCAAIAAAGIRGERPLDVGDCMELIGDGRDGWDGCHGREGCEGSGGTVVAKAGGCQGAGSGAVVA